MKPRRWAGARLIACCLLPTILAGCATYERQPLALQQYARAWAQQLEDDERLADFAERFDASRAEGGAHPVRIEPSDGLTLDEARVVALAFNAELRVARLNAGVPLAGAAQAGRWDDPGLGGELLRITENVDDPWIAGVRLGFTIPLSGRLGIERELAWSDADTAWRGVAAAEAEALAELDRRWLAWSFAQRRAALVGEQADRLAGLARLADRLREAGEVRATDARVFTIELASLRGQLRDEAAKRDKLRLQLLEQIGLTPDASVVLTPSIVYETVETIDRDAAVLRHPRLRSARADYESAEQRLRLAIAKQVPDLTIGPAVGSEEGQSRIGLSAGIPVPVFNANRREIAEAAAERDAAAGEVERVYMALTHTIASAQADLNAASARRAYLADELAPRIDAQLNELDQLIGLGEVEPLTLLETTRQSLQARLAILDATLDQATSATTLRHLDRPTYLRSPIANQPMDHEPQTEAIDDE